MQNNLYENYYHRICRLYPDKKHFILTPEQAKAMVEEIQEARRNGEDKTKEKRMFLKEFTQMFGGRRA